MPEQTEPTFRWRISKRLYDHLTGTGVWAGEDYSHSRPALSAAGHSLRAKVDSKPSRKDGSTHVDLTAAEATVLYEYADTLYDLSRTNASMDDPDNTADMNAARGLLNQAERLPREALWQVGDPN